jgi:P2-related tail formation protein
MFDNRLIPPSIGDLRSKVLMGLLGDYDALDLGILTQLYNPTLCRAEALPYLAEQFGVLDASWAMATTEAAQRTLVLQALSLQRKRGTPQGLKDALTAVGWPGLSIQERSSGWANFKVVQPIPSVPVTQQQLNVILATIDAWKPVRCALDSVQFLLAFTSATPSAGPRYDGSKHHDGSFKYEGALFSSIASVKAGHGAADHAIAAAPTVTMNPRQVVVSFLLDVGDCNGLDVDTYAILTAAGTVICTAQAPAVAKASAVTLGVTWTINLV